MDMLLRQWNLLKLIPRLPCKKSTRTLRDELEQTGYSTSLRTVQRDLEKLEPDFQISSDGHKPAGWHWAKDAFEFNIPGMSPHSAIVFKMVQRHLSHLLPESCLELLFSYFKQSDRVLADIQSQPLADWPEKIAVLSRHLPLQPPRIASDVLFHVYQGLLSSHQIRIMYRRRGEKHAEERVVNPLGLVVIEQTHYLVGTLWQYDDVKHLAMHRIESAEILDYRVRVPKDFDFQTYVASGEFSYPEGDGTIMLKALFESLPAMQFEETSLSSNQKLTVQKDGRILVEAEVRDTAQLRWWLRGFGMNVEVLGPKTLREEFVETSRGLASVYT